MRKALVTEIIAALLMLLFLYAGFSKLADMESYRRSMHNQPFPGWLADTIIWTLPATEIFVAVLIGNTRSRLLGLYLFLLLMSAFSLYIGAILLHVFGDIPCSCGGLIQRLGWGQHFIFNLFFIVVAVSGIRIQRRLKIPQTDALALTEIENISRAKPGRTNT